MCRSQNCILQRRKDRCTEASTVIYLEKLYKGSAKSWILLIGGRWWKCQGCELFLMRIEGFQSHSTIMLVLCTVYVVLSHDKVLS